VRLLSRPLHFLWICLSAGCVFFACDSDSDFRHVRNLKSPGENIVCFGDSLTQGVGAGEGEDYPSILARQLSYPVINAGRGGDTSQDGLERLDRDVLSHNPRLVIVFFGGNDFLRQLPVSETKKNVEEVVRRIQEHGAMVTLVGLRLGMFSDEYGPAYKGIAETRGALYVPEILSGILSDSKLRSDRIHPNGAGYQLVAKRILERIKPLLAEAERQSSKN
jgi:acyl-CoA thioesterase-1